MSVLTEGNYLADWLIDEFGAPEHCREEKVVIVTSDLQSGRVLGVDTLTPRLSPYDNSAPAAATAVLMNSLEVADEKPVTSIVVLTDVATVTTPTPHGLIVGDVVQTTGATVDLQLNANSAVASVVSTTVFTMATSSVSNATYTESTLRIKKANQTAACLVRGPAVVNADGLDFGTSDSTGVTDGLADLLALGIIAREEV